jgi:hypothetical protein
VGENKNYVRSALWQKLPKLVGFAIMFLFQLSLEAVLSNRRETRVAQGTFKCYGYDYPSTRVAYLLKARIVKPAETVTGRELLCRQ